MSARTCLSTVAAGLVLLAAPAAAQEESPVTFSGSAALVSDYPFRGISQSYEDPAIQAGITGAAGSVYLGIWGSSVDFGEAAAADRATAEVDVFGGVKTSLGGVADVDLGVLYYLYPGTGDTYDYNFLEFALGLSRAFSSVTAGVKAAVSPDFFAASGTGVYLGGTLGVSLPSTPISLSASVGRQSIETNSAFGTPDYVDYSIGASLSTLGIGLGAAVIGTDLEESECFGGSELCSTRVVFSVSRAL